ncbi:hypothetical protein L6164_028082 [Bauhinia variegata]|uniref:Uncharacterized protein n=1 Tax=Bauhinia variegata TaxID=167791 RepID=A0ACB9LW24_BAUVA|nr:hypothetical protein L6164_028082 [Bauhinia variegata]
MVERTRARMIEDATVIGGLICVQFGYAGTAVLVSYLMSLGLSALTIVISTSLATFFIIFPVAFYFERSKWPNKLTLRFSIQLVLLSLGGVTLFQSLLIKGINLTSPAMGTAMPNLAPALIFIIAWSFGLEKVDLSCRHGKVKILGTMMCVLGALTVSITQSLTAKEAQAQVETQSPPPSNAVFDKDKIIGCLYLIAAVFMLSSNIVLQASTLGEFPAPMSLCAITSLFGALMTAIAQVIEDHKFKTAWALLSFGDLLTYSVLAGTMNGLCLSINGWALRKKGPVLVSVFNPVATICSVIFSVAILGDTFNIESLAGMFIMFTGLYFVLWAKGKEGYAGSHGLESEFDAKKPLLS